MGGTQSQLDGSSSATEDVVNQAYRLATAFATPTALRAIVELDVLEIIAGAGPNVQLSAAQIASKITTTNPQAPVALDRIMRYLASHSVLTCSDVTGDDGNIVRLYGLTPVSRLFIKSGSGSPFASILLMHQDKVFQDGWQELKYVVLDGVNPFSKAHGMEFFQYLGKDARFSSVFNSCMSSMSSTFFEKMLDIYTGFQDIKELVDVGGGNGTTLHMIVSRYPDMTKAVNFDLPQVISHAPPLPGVEHMGGDMFANVPTSDTIFMKFILHNWSDEHCVKLLKNCFKALPSCGKAIIVDRIIPEVLELNGSSENYFWPDLLMLAQFGAKERTKKEFESLAKEAGFSGFDVTCCLYGVAVMELLK